MNYNKREIIYKIIETTHIFWPKSHNIMVSPTIYNKNNFQPGGIHTIIHPSIQKKIKDQHTEICGRWTWKKLMGKNNHRIILMNSYMP